MNSATTAGAGRGGNQAQGGDPRFTGTVRGAN